MKKTHKLTVVMAVAVLLLTNAMSVSVSASASNPGFTDVPSGCWYEEPVAWAIEQEITNGTGPNTFSPGNTCTKAQVLTFLWRACGSPDSTGINPYQDIAGGTYYYKAALWAYENGMVGGGLFQPDKPCTRSMAVTYMWKQAGRPEASTKLNFSDVAADAGYTQAVAWALETGITNGISDTTFSPESTCTRAQIITFLHRDTSLNPVPDQNTDYVIEIMD